MKDDELADIMLRGLYTTQTPTKRDSLEDIAQAHGNDNEAQIYRVCTYLHNLGVIELFEDMSPFIAEMTSEGARAIQAIGEAESVMEYLHRPAPQNSGVFIQGGVSNSNITSHSSNVNQSIYLNNDVQGILSQISEALKHDSSLSDDQRADALADLESLQSEAGKPKPNFKVARFLLGSLGVVASVAELVEKIKSAWAV